MSSKGSSKILKGSVMYMISYVFFRTGGLIYRLLMGRMLGPDGYGLLGLTLPFQGIFQVLSASGLPPAIAKFVAQHKAVGEEDMARQVIITALKCMMILGIFFGLLMFFSAGWIATNIFHKPDATLPLQAVSLITPFSVIVGAFRGAFQGVYKMELIAASRAVEQIVMISMAVILVSIGFYAAGAVLGTGLGFLASAICAFILFKKYIWVHFPKPSTKFSFMDELRLVKTLFLFSIPVAITGLSEIGMYDIDTLVMGVYLTKQDIGYYSAADPIARLPLIISLSVAAVILPAASEAASLKDKNLLESYVTRAYRYVILLVLPLCVGISIFAAPLISIFGSGYILGSGALSILVIGMAFYTLFMISSSIIQGIGRPRLSMIILVIGVVINLGLNLFMVPRYGIVGAAIATTLAAFIIMATVVWKTFQITEIKPPYLDFGKIVIASGIMGLLLVIIQKIVTSIIIIPNTLPITIIGLILATIIGSFIYIIAFTFIGGFKVDDMRIMRKYMVKLGPLSKVLEKLVKFIERFAK